MSSGLVGRVEQLLELTGKATPGPWEYLYDIPHTGLVDMYGGDSPQTVIGQHMPAPDAELVVAAVNLVEPLARDWQRLKRIEEAARHLSPFHPTAKEASGYPELYRALAASGEPDER